MKVLRSLLRILLALVCLYLISININLNYQPDFETIEGKKLNRDLLHQMAFLKEAFHEGKAEEMQHIYPEGFLFFSALYALSWAEIGEELPPFHPVYEEAMQEIKFSMQAIESPEGKAPFAKGLKPAFGMFYQAWRCYVWGKKLLLIRPERREKQELAAFQQACNAIINSQKSRKSPFIESYPGACWPADMLVGMGAIALANDIFPGKYDQHITQWVQKVKSRLDKHGMIPHACYCGNGTVAEHARGSSMSLMLIFLREIDSDFAQAQFALYKQYFVSSRLGLAAVREYPQGTVGYGDIDSGPVIWGIGGAASIVGQRTLALYGEQPLAASIRNSVEAFGFGKTIGGKKNYLFGKLPMADVFIAWSNAVEVNPKQALPSATHRPFLISIFTLILLLILIYPFLKKIKTNKNLQQ